MEDEQKNNDSGVEWPKLVGAQEDPKANSKERRVYKTPPINKPEIPMPYSLPSDSLFRPQTPNNPIQPSETSGIGNPKEDTEG